jgi:MFS family permease
MSNQFHTVRENIPLNKKYIFGLPWGRYNKLNRFAVGKADTLIHLSASQVYTAARFMVELASTIMFTTYAIYYITVLGLNPLQLILVGTALELTIVLFESITGAVADTYSRRISVIIGMFILGIAFFLKGSIPWFSTVLLASSISLFAALIFAEVVRGIGETFISGAQEAWITDEVGEDKVGGVFLRANQIALYARIVGLAASVALASVSLNLPYVAGGVLYLILAIFLWVAMPETKFQRSTNEELGGWKATAGTWREGLRLVRRRPLLLMVLGVSLFAGAASEGFDRLWEAHFLAGFDFPALGQLKPVVWFGIVGLLGTLLSIATIGAVHRRIDTSNRRMVAYSLFVLTALRIGLIIAFALSPSFVWAVCSFLALSVVGSISGPIYQTWLNQNIESRVRATVLSMMSQSDALGQTAGGPFVGFVGLRHSIRASIVLAALLLSPILLVMGKALRQTEKDRLPK